MNFSIRSSLVWVGAFFLAFIFSVTGVKEFSAWPQVIELWESGSYFADLTGHPHFFRFVSVYPGFLLEEYFPGGGFSLYISIFFAFNCVLWRSFTRRYSGFNPNFIFWLLFFAAHASMNGRGVIAWNAWLMCMHVCFDLVDVRRRVPIFRIALACFFGAVSTGVFIVIVVAVFSFLMKRFSIQGMRIKWIRVSLFFLLSSPLIIVICEYLIIAFEKNIDFYGGGMDGVFRMLHHGMGGAFFIFGEAVALIVVVLVGLISVLFVVIGWKVIFRDINLVQIIPVLGGMFGFTVLTLAIPVFLTQLQKIKFNRG